MVDLALEGPNTEGKQTENIYDEVALVFVKYCPNQELSCILKCMSLYEWTSRDVQQRIDDYQRELRANGTATGLAKLNNHITTVIYVQPSPLSLSLPVSVQCCTPGPSPLSPQAQYHVYCPPPHSPDICPYSKWTQPFPWYICQLTGID